MLDAADVHLDASADAVIKELTSTPRRFVHILTAAPPTQDLGMNLIWKRGLYRYD